MKTQQLIPLRDVPRSKLLPKRRSGSRVSVSTLFRWALHGLRGYRLDTVMVGGQRCTSIEALQEFFRMLTEGQQSHDSTPAGQRSNSCSSLSRARAVAAELDRLGIK